MDGPDKPGHDGFLNIFGNVKDGDDRPEAGHDGFLNIFGNC